MEIKEIIKTVIFFLLVIFILAFMINLGEEKPHEVIINGKKYIRSKEWVGKQYQIIILPIDSVDDHRGFKRGGS